MTAAAWAAASPPSSRAPGDEDGLREIPVDLIDPNPRQPRSSFDETKLAELAESIRARGVLQPIVVRPLAGGRYELVAGERRLRAARIAELDLIPAMVRQADDWERLDLALAENMARQDLNAVEEARACAMLVDDLGLTKEEVGRRVGRSRVAISNLIRLLDLPEEALELIEAGHLSEGHGRAILLCKDHAARRRLARSARDGALVGARDRAPRPRGREPAQPTPRQAEGRAPRPGRGAGRRRGHAVGRARPRGQGARARRALRRRARVRPARRRRSSWPARCSPPASGGRQRAAGRRYNRRSHGRHGRRGRLAQPVRARL